MLYTAPFGPDGARRTEWVDGVKFYIALTLLINYGMLFTTRSDQTERDGPNGAIDSDNRKFINS